MFNSKKQTDKNNKDEQKIKLEIKTMKGDLKNLPSQKESFFVKNSPDKKSKPEKIVKKDYSNSPFANKTAPPINRSLESEKTSPLSKQFLSEKKFTKEKSTTTNIGFEKPKIKELEKNYENKYDSLSKYSTQKKIVPTIKQKINSLPKKESAEIKITEKSTKRLNWKLLAVAIIIFVFALGSGAYYYLSITNKEKEVLTSNQNESKPIEIAETTTEIVVDTSNIPAILAETEIIEIANEQNLKQLLIDFKLEAEQETANGTFYEISKSGEILTATQILEKLEINILGINENSKKGWLYIESDDLRETRKALIIESGLSFVEIKNIILPIENSLPSYLKNLHSPVLTSTGENVVFQTSEVDERFRFFNIIKGNPAKSVDWGIINISKDNEENNLIIFSTSKTTTEKLVRSL